MRERESLRKLLADLQEYRTKTWKPHVLEVNAKQRQELVGTFDPKKAIQIGDTIEPFELLDVEGGTVTLDSLVRTGPAVVIFFRYASCPVCNVTLFYYQRNLWPYLSALGIPLVAISPQIPGSLREIKVRNGLSFIVASDPNNQLARRWGITFEANQAARDFYLSGGYVFPQVIGTGTWELPMPTVVIIDRERIARFVDIAPDWFLRTEAQWILDALRPRLLSNGW